MSRATRSLSILSLFCLSYSAYNPDININLDGKVFQSNNTIWIQMTCLSNKKTIGCTVEFLTNQKSYDHLRGVNNQCYHSGGSCTEQLCTCNDECKQFTLNITTSSEYSKATFGCTVIVEVDNLKYKATTVIKPVQNGFELFNKEIIPLYINNTVQETTTHPPPEVNKMMQTIGLVIAIFSGIICTLSVIAVVLQIVKCCRRKSKPSCPNRNEQNPSQNPQQQGCQKSESSTKLSYITDTNSHTEPSADTEFSSQSNKKTQYLPKDSDRKFRSQSNKNTKYLPHDSDTSSGYSSMPNRRHHLKQQVADTKRSSLPREDYDISRYMPPMEPRYSTVNADRKRLSLHQEDYDISRYMPPMEPRFSTVNADRKRFSLPQEDIERFSVPQEAHRESLNKKSNQRKPYYENKAYQDSLNNTFYHRRPFELSAQDDNLNMLSTYRQHPHEHQASQSSRYTPSNRHTPEHRNTQAPTGSRKQLPSKQDQYYRAPPRSKSVPQFFKIPENTSRHTKDPKSTMNNSNVYYSALPGYRNSTSTHSSSERLINVCDINLENRIMRGQDLKESDA